MNWEMLYLVCFLVGLLLSAFTLLGGMGHFGGHVHVPHAGHIPHGPVHAGGARMPVGHAASAAVTVPWWNAFSIMVFLCWFGASGYLLTRYGTFVAAVTLVLALVCGVIGGAIVFLFLTRFLLPHEHDLTAEETAVTGAVGRVTAEIRAGGTGEMLYEQLGARRSVPARSEDGRAIARGDEVYVVRYEKGIAFVRRWEDLVDPGSKAQPTELTNQ